MPGNFIAEDIPFVVIDLATAELVKVSANAFLATKISFINAMAEVCETSDADVTVLADALGYDKGIGRGFLNAGVGFGGSPISAVSANATTSSVIWRPP
jgi:UDPglucose 6-dehydrogenase